MAKSGVASRSRQDPGQSRNPPSTIMTSHERINLGHSISTHMVAPTPSTHRNIIHLNVCVLTAISFHLHGNQSALSCSPGSRAPEITPITLFLQQLDAMTASRTRLKSRASQCRRFCLWRKPPLCGYGGGGGKIVKRLRMPCWADAFAIDMDCIKDSWSTSL